MLKPNDCISCGEDTSFGSGRFVNRIPADDHYMCAECQMVECDMCDEKINNIFFLGLIVQLVKKFDVFKNLKLFILKKLNLNQSNN